MIMRKNLFCVTIAVAIAATAMAGDTITIKDITSGKYAAENLRSLAPLAGGNHFAQINSDRDKILEYAFDTGEQTGVIFNINDAKGEKIVAIDDYVHRIPISGLKDWLRRVADPADKVGENGYPCLIAVQAKGLTARPGDRIVKD